jgi:LCP family protein required for cell wall assembly
MDPKPINLLTPSKELALGEEQNLSKRSYLLGSVVFFIILVLGTHYTIQKIASWGEEKTGIPHSTEVLKPQKPGIFQTVKNFLFKPENVVVGQKDDRINILLLGMGGEGHEGAYLTDTNIILSIKPSTHEVAMISIPRDLSIKLNNYETGRINNVNALGEKLQPGLGGDYARSVFSKTFNIDIPYYVRVDFKAFVELVDTVGGITINVPHSFTDYSYPGANYSYETISFQEGTQTMDGATALKYSRSRHGGNGEGGDFARSRRQQQVLNALKEKILAAGTYTNPLTVKKIIDSLAHHVSTNLDVAQLLYLANEAKNTNTQNIKTLVLDTSAQGYLYSFRGSSGAYLLGPKGNNFNSINLAIKNIFDPSTSSTASNVATNSPTPSITLTAPFISNAKIELQNGTWQMGLATRIKKQLQDNGLAVQYVGNSPKRPVDTTMIYLLNPQVDNEVVATLAEQMKAQITTTIPEWLTNPNQPTHQPDTDILVVLGTDNKTIN